VKGLETPRIRKNIGLNMTLFKSKLYVIAFLSVFSLNAAAVSVEITQSSLFLSVPSSPATPGPQTGTSYQDDQLGFYSALFPSHNTFGSGGFGVHYTDTVVDSLGSLTWSITNNSGVDIANSEFTGFLDVDLGDVFFQNFGAIYGDVNSHYDSWEIDDPDPFFGDIYQHVQNLDPLDNTNNLPPGLPGDVSLALGFDIDNWLIGETIIATFLISDALVGPAALAQFDLGDTSQSDGIYFSGSIDRASVIPIPGAGGLMLSGLVFLAVARRRKKIQDVN